MLEFIFFNDDLRDQFVEFAESLDLECESRLDELGTVVMVPEDLPEEIEDQLEQRYADLMEEQAALADQETDVHQHQAVGIRVTLTDGSEHMIRLEPDMANRLLECLSLQEIQELVNAIAASLSDDSDKPLCQP